MLRWSPLLLLMILAACDTEGASSTPAASAVFPADFATSFIEVRDCRHSHEHELNHIRVLANALAKDPYAALSADSPYPEGSVIVKAEYEDDACTKLVGYTALRKEAAGFAPETGDWRWQKLDTGLRVQQDGTPAACVTCHEHHCAPAGLASTTGYDLTCAEEI